MSPSRSVKGSVVLVTGAGGGMGAATAQVFAAEGAHVAVTDRNGQAAQAVADTIAAQGQSAQAWPLDVSDPAAILEVVGQIAARFGGLDCVINNAGVSGFAAIDDEGYEAVWERSISVLLTSHHRVIRAALPHLRKSSRGRVICIGGTAARHAGATALPSALGNSSIIAFVKQFSGTVAAQGITANTVHPPFTKTDRYPKRLAARAKQLGVSEAEAEKTFIKRFPIGRLIEPKDIAPMVLFLASPLASAITGQSITIDGGSTPGTYY